MSSLSDSNKIVFLDIFFSYFTPTFDEIDIQIQNLSEAQQKELFTLSMNHVLNMTNIDDIIAILAIYKNMGVLHIFIDFLHNLNKKQGGKKKTRRRMKKKRKKTKNKRGGAKCFEKCIEDGARSCEQIGCGSCDIPVDGGTYLWGAESVLQAAREGNYPICLPALDVDNKDGERKDYTEMKVTSPQPTFEDGITLLVGSESNLRKEVTEQKMILIRYYKALLDEGKITSEQYDGTMTNILEGIDNDVQQSKLVLTNMIEQRESMRQRQSLAKMIFLSAQRLNEKLEQDIKEGQKETQPLRAAKAEAKTKLEKARKAIQVLIAEDWNSKMEILNDYIKIRKDKIDMRSVVSILAVIFGSLSVGGLGWAMGETLETVMTPVAALLGAFVLPVEGVLGIFSWLKSFFVNAPPPDPNSLGLSSTIKAKILSATGGLKLVMLGTTVGVGAASGFFLKRFIMGEGAFIDTNIAEKVAYNTITLGGYTIVKLIEDNKAIKKELKDYERLETIKAAKNTIEVVERGENFKELTKAQYMEDFTEGKDSNEEFGKMIPGIKTLVRELEMATKELGDHLDHVKVLKDRQARNEEKNHEARMGLMDSFVAQTRTVVPALLEQGLRRRRNPDRFALATRNEQNKTNAYKTKGEEKKEGGFRKKKKKSKKKTHKKKKNKKSKTRKKR
jgi:hypothetical protein